MTRIMGVLLALLLLPGSVAAQDFTYGGRAISVKPGVDGADFVTTIKKAIDMAEGLPAPLKQLAATVKVLRYEPSPTSGADRTASDDIIGVYTMTSRDEAKGYISFKREPRRSAPVDFALSMVGNGVYARRHQEYVELRRKVASGKADAQTQARHDYYDKLMNKKDINLVVKAECELLQIKQKAMEAFELPPRRLEGGRRLMVSRGC